MPTNYTSLSNSGGRARNWPRPIVRDDQESRKDELLVLPDKCPCFTIIIRKNKWYFWEGLVNFSASCPTGQVEI